MGMGWKECSYNLERKRRKCKCGSGEFIVSEHIYEESDYPPFVRADREYGECKCPNNCEKNYGRPD